MKNVRFETPLCLCSGPLRGSAAVKAAVWLVQHLLPLLKQSSLLSSVCLCNCVWPGVDRAGPCVGNRSPDSGPKVSCPCFLLSSGSHSECSHTMARLDICGQQIEMQVVMVKNDWCLSAGFTRAGGGCKKIYHSVCMQNIYARKHTLLMT